MARRAGLCRGARTVHRPERPNAQVSMIRAAFDDIIRPFLDHLLVNPGESRTLAQTRDLLLPKLMSGEIRLREAEKTIETMV